MLKIKLLLCFSILCCIINAQIPANDKNWDLNTLLFQDEFTGTAIDNSKWNAINDGTNNQYFDFNSNNVTVINYSGINCLNLKVTDGNTSGKPIHASYIVSDNSFGCGYYEIRCKIHCWGSSYMPAFWVMFGLGCSPPCDNCETVPGYWYKENDFFEIKCNPNNFNMSSNAHYYSGCNYNYANDPLIPDLEDGGDNLYVDHFVSGTSLYNEFHTYGYEWTPERVIFYLDGEPYRTLNYSLIDNTPLYIRIDNKFQNGEITDATFPGDMYVDYVRVYNLKRNCIDETITNFNSGTYKNYAVKKSITITGTSSISSTHKVTLRAQNEIKISGDFTVASGGELTLLPTECY